MSSRVFILASLLLLAFAAPSNLSQLRSEYLKAASDEDAAEKIIQLTEGKKEALSIAYRGAAWAIKAKHQFYPGTKLDYVKKGLKELNNAVTSDSKDVEIRFLRFSVEENIPGIVSFTSHVNADKKFILDNIKSTHAFYGTMKNYMLKSKNLSEAEKKKLK